MPDTKTVPTKNSDGQPIVKPGNANRQQSTQSGVKQANADGQPIVKP